jgi:predicted peptidase
MMNKNAFQAIAVMPQVRNTWAAGSDDAKAALAILDTVLKEFKTDPKRVILTGLSLGGRGSWEIAAEAGRFAAVVPICGFGNLEDAKHLAALPIWAFCGDLDGESRVLNVRAMVEAINASGGKAKLTEYRSVGHDSWDRAYNDPALIAGCPAHVCVSVLPSMNPVDYNQ